MQQITAPHGTTISFDRYGSGPPLVLVHGSLSDHISNWQAVAQPLGKLFTVYAIARRGRGETTASTDHSIQQEFANVAAVIQSIGKPVFLLGHSYGAHVALGAAGLVPHLVARLVIYEAPWPHAMSPELLEDLERLEAAGRWDDLVEQFLRDAIQLPPEVIAEIRESPDWQSYVGDAEASMRDWRALVGYQFKPEAFAPLQMRVLLLVGSESPRATYVTDALAAKLPDVKIVELPGQGHEAAASAPELFVETVSAFLTA